MLKDPGNPYAEEALVPRGGPHDLVWPPPEQYPGYVPASR